MMRKNIGGTIIVRLTRMSMMLILTRMVMYGVWNSLLVNTRNMKMQLIKNEETLVMNR